MANLAKKLLHPLSRFQSLGRWHRLAGDRLSTARLNRSQLAKAQAIASAGSLFVPGAWGLAVRGFQTGLLMVPGMALQSQLVPGRVQMSASELVWV